MDEREEGLIEYIDSAIEYFRGYIHDDRPGMRLAFTNLTYLQKRIPVLPHIREEDYESYLVLLEDIASEAESMRDEHQGIEEKRRRRK